MNYMELLGLSAIEGVYDVPIQLNKQTIWII